jgi:hypothetical protein
MSVTVLQGPSTDSVAVKRLRLALEEGNPICEIILNYKQTGEPFWNCLSMLPLRGKKGEIVYFIGSSLSFSLLSFLPLQERYGANVCVVPLV